MITFWLSLQCQLAHCSFSLEIINKDVFNILEAEILPYIHLVDVRLQYCQHNQYKTLLSCVPVAPQCWHRALEMKLRALSSGYRFQSLLCQLSLRGAPWLIAVPLATIELNSVGCAVDGCQPAVEETKGMAALGNNGPDSGRSQQLA